jgi:hypothetical protein
MSGTCGRDQFAGAFIGGHYGDAEQMLYVLRDGLRVDTARRAKAGRGAWSVDDAEPETQV